jgi:hypothetical protein
MTDEQRRAASLLNLCPDTPEEWPMAIVDRLVWMKENLSDGDFHREFLSLIGTNRPAKERE